MSEAMTPFQRLCEIDRQCRQRGLSLPARRKVAAQWGGIGFRLRQHHCVVPMGELGEVLHEPRQTRLPGVREWVRGVANVRGRLLPIMDLGQLLGFAPVAAGPQRRVLVVEQDEVFAGLLVDEVFGMQHFAVSSFNAALPALEGPLQPLVQGVFRRERDWLVFSPHALVVRPAFLDVAR